MCLAGDQGVCPCMVGSTLSPTSSHRLSLPPPRSSVSPRLVTEPAFPALHKGLECPLAHPTGQEGCGSGFLGC